MNIAELLSRSARLHGDATALRYAERELGYAQLDQLAARFGSALIRMGLHPGDRVAVFMRNCPEYVITMFGTFRARMVLVPINAKLSAKELTIILADSGAQALVYGADTASTVDAADTAEVQRVKVTDGHGADADGGDTFALLVASDDPPLEPTETASDELAWLFYTSGTTGRPKGAELTHRNLMVMTWALLADVCKFEADDRVLHVAPLSHGSGLYLLGAIASGAENLIYDGSGFEPGDILQLIESERVSVIAFVVPTMIIMLLRAKRQAETSSLRCVIYGGSPIHDEHATEMVERFGAVFVQIYGQGESPMTITYLDAHAAKAPGSLGSAGVPHPGVDVRVLDDDGETLPPGERGEVCVRGDVVMRGYWRDPDSTAGALRSGWLHTSDIGYFDFQGRLFLIDRKHDTIISGGANIYPREVEETLIQHPAVSEVAVFGVPDEVWGESVVAAVVPTGDSVPDEAELVELCRSQLASFKKPKRVILVEELPKNAYGKVLRSELRQRWVESAASEGQRLRKPTRLQDPE